MVAGQNQKKIALLDNNIPSAGDLSSRIETFGYQVCIARGSQEEIVKLLERTTPDVILMDINWESEILRTEIENCARYRFKIPVVFMIPENDVDRFDMKQNGCPHMYIVKPFRDGDLRAALHMAHQATRMDSELGEARHELQQRTGELNTQTKILRYLYAISHLMQNPEITLEEILRKAVDLIPSALPDPESAFARLIFDQNVFTSSNFRETADKLQSGIILHGHTRGSLEVHYLQERSANDTDPFIDGERKLIEMVAGRLGEIIETVQTRQVLKESRHTTNVLLSSMDNMVFVLDPEGNILEINDAVTNILEYTERELKGRSLFAVYPEGRHKKVRRILSDAAVGNTGSCAIELIQKDGNRIPVENHTVSGTWCGKHALFSIFKKIPVLQASQDRITKIFHSNPAPMAVATKDEGLFIDVNQAFLDTTGYARNEVVGHTSIELGIHPNFEQRKAIVDTFQEDSSSRIFETCIRTKNNSILHGLFSVEIMTIGKVEMLLTTMIDITERKRAEDELKMFKAIVESTEEAISIRDPKGGLVYINRAYEQLFGWSLEEGRKIDCSNYYTPESLKLMRMIVAPALSEGMTWEGVLEVYDARGRCFPIWRRGDSVLNEDGHVLYTFGFMHDISEEKEVEENLRNALREKEILLQEVHHRVKNNLQIVNSLLKLQTMSIKDQSLKQALIDSRNRVYTMALVHETIYGSKNMASIDLNQYVSGLIRSLSQAYEINLNLVHYNVDIENIEIDLNQASYIGLVINELLSNALKYAFPQDVHGEITIRARQMVQNEIELTVADNGVGFPDGFDWRNSESMGFQLLNILAEQQLQGTVELDLSRGTSFTIRFKHHTED